MPTIDLSNTKEYYSLFYQAGFLLGLAVLMAEGIRRKFEFSSWFILIASTLFMGILGSRFGTYGLAEWKLLFKDGTVSNFGQKSAVGGIAFGILGFLIVKKILNLKNDVIDAFAFFLPVLMLFQRIGCLCAGCCFGSPYSGFGSIRYSGFSFIRDYHLHEGWINYNEINSAPVHAVPLYLIGVSILTVVVLVLTKNRQKQEGSLFLLSVICMGAGRFFVEFFRDSITNHSAGTEVFGIKTIQWIILISVTLGIAVYWWNENKATYLSNVIINPKPSREILTVLVLSFLVFKTKAYFTSPEIVVLHSVIALSLLGIIRHLVQISLRPKLKLVPYLLIFSSVFLMSQTYHYRDWNLDTGKTQTIVTTNLLYKDAIQTQYPCLQTAEGCGGTYCSLADTAHPMGPEYFAYNVGVDRYVKTNKKFDINYGVNAQLEQYQNREANYTSYRFNAYPYFGMDGQKYFGFRTGVRFGNMYSDNLDNRGTENVLPAGRFWFGVKNYATIQVGIFDSDFAGPYSSILDLRTNFNLKKLTKNKVSQFSLGVSFSNTFPSFYGQTEIYLKPDMALIPRIGQTVNTYSETERKTGLSIGLGFRYNVFRK